MGYTHRWTLHPRRVVSAGYARAVVDAKLIIVATAAQFDLRVEEDDAQVLMDGPEGATCETFAFFKSRRALEHHVAERRQELARQFPRWSKAQVIDQARFDFCKTNRQPYDVVVTARLCVLAEAGLPVFSDGDACDWEPGRQLAEEVLKRPVALPPGIECAEEAAA